MHVYSLCLDVGEDVDMAIQRLVSESTNITCCCTGHSFQLQAASWDPVRAR
jgi:hypothetical protein